MCDKAGKSVNQAAAQVAEQPAEQLTTPGDAMQVDAAATATPQVTAHRDVDSKKAQIVDPEFARAENEDDDGYDPYSDRRPVSEPLFERDPWS